MASANLVRRLAAAVFFLKKNVAGKVQGFKIRFKNILIGNDQVPCPQLKIGSKVPARIIRVIVGLSCNSIIRTDSFQKQYGYYLQCTKMQSVFQPYQLHAIRAIINMLRERTGSGVPSGLQNQHGELTASQVGSIPTLSRQKRKKGLSHMRQPLLSFKFVVFSCSK